MNAPRVDLLLQFALVAAGQEDEQRDRRLGPIQLVKYAYLGDLAYAEAHQGETFTGAAWQFHHFGPWDAEVFGRIEPALAAIGTIKERLPGAIYGDFERYTLQDEHLLDGLSTKLPGEVAGAIRRAVHEHGSDTASLLRDVYQTRPMLTAAPGEALVFEKPSRGASFSTVDDSELASLCASSARVAEPQEVWTTVPLRLREQRRTLRKRKQMALRLREAVRQRLAGPQAPTQAAVPAPRYDDVFFDGVAWLDHQAGEPVPATSGELEFSHSIWKSRGRSDSGGDAS